MHNSAYQYMEYFVKKYLRKHKDKPLKILDFGSQDVNGTNKPLFHSQNWKYTGCDICSGENVDIIIQQPYNWDSIKSNHYDVVVSSNVFEHVEYPWRTMMEVRRALKPNGIFCCIVPAVCPEHKYPLDCYRFYSDGVAALSNYAAMEVLEVFTDWELKISNQNLIDTILICRKTKLSFKQWIKVNIKSFVARMIN